MIRSVQRYMQPLACLVGLMLRRKLIQVSLLPEQTCSWHLRLLGRGSSPIPYDIHAQIVSLHGLLAHSLAILCVNALNTIAHGIMIQLVTHHTEIFESLAQILGGVP